MTSWVAIAYGALDLSDQAKTYAPVELMLLSVLPAEPIGLQGEAAALWRLLAVQKPVADEDLSESQRSLVREFAEAGIASSDPTHSARVVEIHTPWFSSPLHELICGLIASLARDHQIRFVVIKGPVLHRQGLRKREHSGDIDLWVDPKKVVALSRALEPWGWTLAPNFWGEIPAYHSLTLTPTEWGCEIDLHRHMPGCAAPDSEAFSALTAHSSALNFAGVSALVPTPPANAVLAALHFTRPHPYPNPPSTVVNAVDVLKLGGEKSLSFSDEVKATAALAPVLRQTFPDALIEPQYGPPLNWRWRAEANPLRRAVLSFRSVPASSWPRFIGRLFWPEPEIALKFDRAHGGKSSSAFTARMRRLGFGITETLARRR